MNRPLALKFRQPIFRNGQFAEWHFWGIFPTLDCDGKFIEPVISYWEGRGDIDITQFPEGSQQFIGRLDKNGKEIYEGDIVTVDDREIGAKNTSTGEVYYCTDYTLESNPCFAGWGERGHFQLSPNIEIISKDRIERPKDNKHCQCEMPFWTVEDIKHCAECHKLLPDIKEE